MLGRGVAEALLTRGPESLFAPEVVAAAHEADLFVLNLECCISERGRPWPDPYKPFFFRAPPVAVEALKLLGVDCVTLANNHALDYGDEALLDTFEQLQRGGVKWVAAGRNVEEARAPVVLETNGFRLAVIGVTDHPEYYAAGPETPGVAYADLQNGVPDWLLETIRSAEADAVLVTPHWGPNMAPEPRGWVKNAARAFVEAGATLVAGHSAHVFQGVEGPVLYDLGDFVDDYAVDPELRNDLGLLWLVELEADGASRIEALPLKLDYCHTRVAEGADEAWVAQRFEAASTNLAASMGTEQNRPVVVMR